MENEIKDKLVALLEACINNDEMLAGKYVETSIKDGYTSRDLVKGISISGSYYWSLYRLDDNSISDMIKKSNIEELIPDINKTKSAYNIKIKFEDSPSIFISLVNEFEPRKIKINKIVREKSFFRKKVVEEVELEIHERKFEYTITHGSLSTNLDFDYVNNLVNLIKERRKSAQEREDLNKLNQRLINFHNSKSKY